jgi:SAM-dependent methyltransferase
VLGLDISAPMLEVAVERAGACGVHPKWVFAARMRRSRDSIHSSMARSADSALCSLPILSLPSRISMTRCGPGGRLAFVCWRHPAENPWMMVPLEAALRFVPPPPPMDPTAPGPFAFADASRVRAILMAAGFE